MALAAGLSGCGSTGAPRSPGRALFAEDCSVCHSLSGARSPRLQGGDLLGLHVRRQAMLQFVQEMPVRHRLAPSQVRTVADYVLAVERRGQRAP
jgi:mono/diheme cytochrome c family protein